MSMLPRQGFIHKSYTTVMSSPTTSQTGSPKLQEHDEPTISSSSFSSTMDEIDIRPHVIAPKQRGKKASACGCPSSPSQQPRQPKANPKDCDYSCWMSNLRKAHSVRLGIRRPSTICEEQLPIAASPEEETQQINKRYHWMKRRQHKIEEPTQKKEKRNTQMFVFHKTSKDSISTPSTSLTSSGNKESKTFRFFTKQQSR